IVTRFHGLNAGEAARATFTAQFSQGVLPDHIVEVEIAAPPEGLPIARVLREAGLVASNAEGGRMVDQRAVRVDQQRIEDRSLVLQPGESYLLQVGSRRYARARLVCGRA